MAKGRHKPNPFLTDEDNPPLDEDFFRRAKPVPPALVSSMEEIRKKVGRPRCAAPKVILTLRLAQDVVAKLRASGPGYNARAEQILRDALNGRIKRRRIRRPHQNHRSHAATDRKRG